MNFLMKKNIKPFLRVDGFYIGISLCMIILAIKFFIDRN